ncbi:MAG: formate--tetrahydrofolate ligase [Desulfovibrionaceae bacterium]|nr:formate--tetrahydrofolate ligase [Desulfovibrionaceae bacterium]
MALDPRHVPDWQIALDAEQNMKTVETLAAELGLEKGEVLPYGHHIAKVDASHVCARLAERPNGKYIDVTAITPTPLGEGKSTTTIGLVQGLAKRGKNSTAAIRQPSAGPVMGMKGSAAGGGLAQCIPLVPYSLNFTGDMHAVTQANNMAMTALTARMQHERNYDDEKLVTMSGQPRLNIDPTQVRMTWAIDFCAQALRNVIIGIEGDGRRNDGFMMRSGFVITAASEVMTILALATDLTDLRRRLGNIVVALDRHGKPVTCEDLQVAGAMTAWLTEAIKPNLIQTLEGQPVFVHAGPFANISLGQSSIIADKVALKLSDYHVTESGFGSEIGYEKFWNVKCVRSGLAPDAVVIVATIRALKRHGGAPAPVPGRPMPEAYTRENVDMVEAGCQNLLRHIGIVRKSGVPAVVCLNSFVTDTPNEIKAVRRFCESAGARFAVSEHWAKGGDGALELADAVLDATREKSFFTPLFTPQTPFDERIRKIASEVYGADGVEISPTARRKLADLQAREDAKDLSICMVKTQYSLSDNAQLTGAPTGWQLVVRDVLFHGGAGLVIPVAGDMSLMPGTGSRPSYRNIDVNTNTGTVTGLF